MTLESIATVIGYLATVGGFILFLAKVWRKIKAMANGQMCLLRSDITSVYYRHCEEDKPTLREYERKNIDDLYSGYKALGGNHFVDDIYNDMRDWHVVS